MLARRSASPRARARGAVGRPFCSGVNVTRLSVTVCRQPCLNTARKEFLPLSETSSVIYIRVCVCVCVCFNGGKSKRIYTFSEKIQQQYLLTVNPELYDDFDVFLTFCVVSGR